MTTGVDADRIDVIAHGVDSMSVCAPLGMSREVVELGCNHAYPSGTDGLWRVSQRGKFSCGHDNPGPCQRDGGRMHYLLEC